MWVFINLQRHFTFLNTLFEAQHQPAMTSIAYAHMRFSPDFARAVTPAGEEIRFSRRERTLLAVFTDHAHQVVSRERLLNAIAAQDADVLDRHIDYIVSRLRRKLGDSTRRPVFIATEYGEGYRWIAARGPDESAPEKEPDSEVFLVIGPLRGMQTLGRYASSIMDSLEHIREELEIRFAHADGVTIVIEKGEERFPSCRFSLEISVLNSGDNMRVSSILRDGRSGYIHQAWQVIPDWLDTRAELAGPVSNYVDEIHQCVLSASMAPPAAIRSANQLPLEVALDQTAALLSGSEDKYRETSDFLRRRLQANPDDHHTGILLASNLHVAMVRQDPATLTGELVSESLMEMESLVMEHLGGVQDEPLFLGTAAKLLYFVGHRELALELAETALDQDVSHAATLMMYAQLQMLEGDLDCALEYYDFALQHSRDDQFRSMILVLKATALRAQGSFEALPDIVNEIVARDEDVRLLMHASLLGDRPECDASVLEIAPLLPVEQWQQLLRLNYYVNVRLFREVEHRERLIQGILQLAIRNGGPAVVFEELERELPELCVELTQQAAAGRAG